MAQTDNETANRRQLFQAASIVMAAILLSRILGVLRDSVISVYFEPESVEITAYVVASRIPQLIFTVIAGGALGSAFIPTFSAFFADDDPHGGWRLYSTILNLAAVAAGIACALAALFAPQLIQIFYGDLVGQYPAFLPTTVKLLRVMLLSTVIFSLSGVTMGALNARQHFLTPALAASVYNIGIILGAVLFPGQIMGLAYGVVGGALGHLLIQLPALRQHRAIYSPIFTLQDPSVRQVLRLMAPRVLGLSFSELTLWLTTVLAQPLILGSIRALELGWKLMSVPLGFLGQALGIAAFPTFATLAAEGKRAEMRRILAETLRLILFLGMPATVGLAMLRRPIAALLFQYGASDADSIDLIAWATLFYAVGLIGLALIEVIARAFYALSDTTTPVLAGGLQLAGMAALGWLFSRWLFPAMGWRAFGGLALGHSLANLGEMGLLLWLLRRKLGGIDGAFLWDGAWRIGVAGIGMGFILWGVIQLAQNAGIVPLLFWAGLASGLAYAAFAAALRLGELRLLLRPIRRLFAALPEKLRF